MVILSYWRIKGVNNAIVNQVNFEFIRDRNLCQIKKKLMTLFDKMVLFIKKIQCDEFKVKTEIKILLYVRKYM